MPRYRVFIHGKNFLLRNEGSLQRLGFFTTRFVNAPNRDDAKAQAVKSVLEHPNLFDSVENVEQDPPIVDIEEVEQMSSSDDSTDTGLAFYVDEVST